MEDTQLHPEEESIIVYGYFVENDSGLDQQAENKDMETEAQLQDKTEHTHYNDIYTGKPLALFYSTLLPVFNIITTLLLL